MIMRLLDSGYWHARWSDQAWAQWPKWRAIERKDFFQPDWSCTRERLTEIAVALDAAQERG
mgnify:CR=1 FL=1